VGAGAEPPGRGPPGRCGLGRVRRGKAFATEETELPSKTHNITVFNVYFLSLYIYKREMLLQKKILKKHVQKTA